MRRVRLVPILLLLLTLLVWLTVSPLWAQTSPPVPLADILRGPYEAPVEPIMATADVLRGPYEGMPQEAAVPVISLADVNRGPYEAPAAPPELAVSTADVLRGPYAVPVVRRGDQPLADILRGPYDAPQPAFSWSLMLAWVMAGFAFLTLFAALILDLLRRKRHAAHLPSDARPLGHAH